MAEQPHLHRLTNAVLAAWPEHEAFLERRFSVATEATTRHAEQLAGYVLTMAGADVDRYCVDYRWTCDRLLEEERYFRLNGSYRRSTFAEVAHDLFEDPTYMERYQRGLLLSQVLWSNHADALEVFRSDFLRRAVPGYRLLEIGPGHGLLLALAASDERSGPVVGWDISAASIATAAAGLGAARPRGPSAIGARGRWRGAGP